MEKMTAEQAEILNTLDIERQMDFYDQKTLKLVAMKAIGEKDKFLFDWLQDVVIEFQDWYVGSANFMRFENKIMYLKFEGRTILRNASYTIKNRIEEDMHYEVSSYKHIENVLPYALQVMFHGETPNNEVKMLKHFQQDNFAFVTYKVQIERTRGRGNNKRTLRDNVIREVVIERWGENGENYKTKKSKGKEQFKDLMTQMEAPKVKYINVQISTLTLDKYSSAAKHVNIDIDSVTKDSTLTVNEEYKFDSAFVLKEVTKPYVVYNNGEAVWFAFRKDTYNGGIFLSSNVEAEKFFQINEYGGLVEIPTNPFRYKMVSHEEPPEVSTTPKTDDDIYLDVTPDETEVIIPFDHDYINVEITKETYEAREYTMTNKITAKYKLTYFTRYNDQWIHTTKRNHKVKLMLDSYKMIDIMHADEQEGA